MKITIPYTAVIISLFAVSFFSCDVGRFVQGDAKMYSEGMREREISLKYEIEGNEYKVGDDVTIRYIVRNDSQQEIYLISEIDEPTLFSHIDRSRSTPYLNNDLHILMKKSQVPSEDIEFPKLEKL